METSLKEEIIVLRKKGKSYNEIKNILGCSKATISYHCKREVLSDIGLDQSKKLKKEEIERLKIFYINHTLEETSKEFEVSTATVKKYADKKRYIFESDDERRKANYTHVKDFRNRNKQRAVEYKGGKCSICGYSKCVKALEFHHINPDEKDFTLGSNANIAWEKVKKEIEKCVLLCANCHREVHDGIARVTDSTSPS